MQCERGFPGAAVFRGRCLGLSGKLQALTHLSQDKQGAFRSDLLKKIEVKFT